jgi:hypothetical protein
LGCIRRGTPRTTWSPGGGTSRSTPNSVEV